MRVLAVGAHPDDIELGCGGSLIRHAQGGHEVTMLVMTPGERGPQGMISRVREQERATRIIGGRLVWGHFHDGAIPNGQDSVAVIDAVVREINPDVVYVHAPHDTHQDHVATSQAATAAARRTARTLYYQSPSTTSFDPTLFIDVEQTLQGKLDALRAHWSQVTQCEFVDLGATEAGCRYWGSRARVSYAEPFETQRFLWEPVPAVALATPLQENLDFPETPTLLLERA